MGMRSHGLFVIALGAVAGWESNAFISRKPVNYYIEKRAHHGAHNKKQ